MGPTWFGPFRRCIDAITLRSLRVLILTLIRRGTRILRVLSLARRTLLPGLRILGIKEKEGLKKLAISSL